MRAEKVRIRGGPVPRRWAIWGESRRTVLAVLAVEMMAAVGITCLAASGRLGSAWVTESRIWLAVVFVAVGIAHLEIVRVTEKVRRAISGAYVFSFGDVWMFGAALVLPLTLSIPVVVVVYQHSWVRSWRPHTALYRSIYSTTSLVLAVTGASAAVAGLHRIVGRDDAGFASPILSGHATPLTALDVAVALLTYGVINHLVVTLAVALSAPDQRGAALWGSWADRLQEFAVLCLAVLAAAASLLNPALVAFVPAPLAVLARAALVRELRDRVDRDGKTGLLNAAAWEQRAAQVLASPVERRVSRPSHRARRRGRAIGVLMIDIDRFKAINDTHGHVAGDAALRQLARTLSDTVRAGDLVGRFGGEEFVVLVVHHEPDADSAAEMVAAVAERVRSRVAAQPVTVPTPDGDLTLRPLTVSIGAVVIAARPGARTAGLTALIGHADRAVYAAKAAGRDRVWLSAAGAGSAPGGSGPGRSPQ